MTQYFNQAWSKSRRRDLRKKMTPAEAILWEQLRNRGLGGFKFRRQFGIGSYITDFYCPEKNLVIEVDGGSHEGDDAHLYDVQRDAFFEGLGIGVMRISNESVLANIEKVIEDIILRLGE